jgi:glycosyltransferase involved in cell wall biosynthesis
MRIGLLLNNPSPHQVDWLNALSKENNADCFIGYVHESNPDRTWGVPKPELPWSHLPTSLISIFSGRLKRWIHSQKADVWVLSSIYTSPVTQYLAWLLQRTGCKTVFMGEPPRPNVGLKGIIQFLLLRSILNKVSAVLATGEEAVRKYQSLVNPGIPVVSMPYYIDISNFNKQTDKENEQGEVVRFVVAAQLIHRKGIDVLIEACNLLPKEGWTLDIYGTGDMEKQLVRQAEDVGSFIRFCGAIPYESRYQIYNSADVFVFPTRWDGWGMVIPESLAHGVPVISTDHAMSAYEFIIDGQNGYIGPANDPGYFADRMSELIKNPEKLSTLSGNCQSSLKNYSPEIGASRLLDFLNDL